MTAPATAATTAVEPIAPSRVLGCDVGKSAVVVFDSLTGRITEIANDAGALATLTADLARNAPSACLVVCEATGGYESALLAAVAAAGIPAHRADARKVKAFIRSLGRLGKTDAIDARALARYGQERHAGLSRWQPAPRVGEDLSTLTRLRTRLVKQRVALTNQLRAPGGAVVKHRLQAICDAVSDQVTAIEAEMRGLVENDPATAAAVALIEEIPGCGHRTAVTLAALMPELGTLSRRRAAGLAPHPRQSGQHDGYRRVRGGRPEVKRALFMAAMAARNHNPDLKTVYDRLIANGKKTLVALTALMRKLITIINARIRVARKPTPPDAQPAAAELS